MFNGDGNRKLFSLDGKRLYFSDSLGDFEDS